MGCDIHGAVEIKVDGVWHLWAPLEDTCRDYERFGALAGVRSEGPPPRGLPGDMSVVTKLIVDDWGVDGHSHSWLPIREAAKVFASTGGDGAPDDLDMQLYKYFGYDSELECLEDLSEARLVFWFDN